MITEAELEKRLNRVDRVVRAFPANGQWFKDKNRGTFVRTAMELIERGLPERDVITFLRQLYQAVAGEYGE